jgi:hypothetical protein
LNNPGLRSEADLLLMLPLWSGESFSDLWLRLTRDEKSSRSAESNLYTLMIYLDFAELQAQAGKVMYMRDWIEKLDAFLRFNEKDILQNSGRVSQEVAKALAEKEFKKFARKQDRDYISDFDREVKKLLKKSKKK